MANKHNFILLSTSNCSLSGNKSVFVKGPFYDSLSGKYVFLCVYSIMFMFWERFSLYMIGYIGPFDKESNGLDERPSNETN